MSKLNRHLICTKVIVLKIKNKFNPNNIANYWNVNLLLKSGESLFCCAPNDQGLCIQGGKKGNKKIANNYLKIK